jgi:serine/threonine protein kinase/tetratricopeptide (TPR) repeat protein
MEPDDDKTQTHVVLTKGTIVGHYRIIEKIGAGGMGEIYLAEDTQLDRKVALKFLPSHLCQDEDCRKRFKREAQAAAKLSHPNIIHVYEVSEYQGRPFFVMEHVEGRSLREVKAEELDIDRIVGIAIQLCDGLQSAHASGVIHRDIKPSNIIIDFSGRPKLLDFGLAAVKGGEDLTKTGSTLGTVGYMSPEQIEGKTTDARSDLFSLGVVLYELIANKSPFRRDDETATLKAILQDAPQPLARYNSNAPNDLQRIVSKLLEKDPSLRYQSAAGVIPDLKRLSSTTTSSIMVERKRTAWSRYVVPMAVIILSAVVATWYFGYHDRTPSSSAKDDKIMLAVLPFENLGNPEDEYFSDGITDEIIAKLARIKKLRVTSRTSSMQYKNTEKSLVEIGRELGVDYVLEGTIRWDKSDKSRRIRITPQLIRIADDSPIWVDIYERALIQVFEVQAEIAGEIASALDITLAPSEQKSIRSQPTENLKAYDLYLRARRQFLWDTDRDKLGAGFTLYQKAVELDTTFVAAYTEMSWMHSWFFWMGYDQSEARSELARVSAEKAMQFDADSALSHIALGYYFYYCRRDLVRAEFEFALALEKLPDNTDVLAAMGYIKRRTGDWPRSIELQEKAMEIDPKMLWIANGLGESYRYTRDWQKLSALGQRTISLFPEKTSGYNFLSNVYLWGEGDPVKTKIFLDSIPLILRNAFRVKYAATETMARNFDAAAKIYRDRLPTANSLTDTIWTYIRLAELMRFLNRLADEHTYWDSARKLLEPLYERPAPVGSRMLQPLGVVYAGLGRKQDAIDAALGVVADLPLSDDYFLGSDPLYELAHTYVLTGDYDKAITLLDNLLSVPSEVTVALLKLYPLFDPLRDHPRFQALMDKYEKEQGI